MEKESLLYNSRRKINPLRLRLYTNICCLFRAALSENCIIFPEFISFHVQRVQLNQQQNIHWAK